MGMIFGKITVETPQYEVLHTCPDYEIRSYAPSVVAQVTYDPAQMRGDRDGGFMILASYIGALGSPQNARPEKIAMTAPVFTQGGGGGGGGGASEEIVTTASTAGPPESLVTMRFVLPSGYRRTEDAPAPLDGRVVIGEEGPRKYGVVRFGGTAGDGAVAKKAEGLRRSLERDGHRMTGRFLLARYNPPWTLPPFRTNEVMLPVD